ncbi:hypothetical protein BC332_16759 [Capsicum chinense]|nr:hypothetical protein BC332_16759 [Capsicum chinense]
MAGDVCLFMLSYVVLEEVELEPPAEDEDEQLSSDNRDFNDGEPQKKGIKKKRCTQQKTKKQRRVEVVAILMDSFGKMHMKGKQVARTAKYLAKLFQICLNCDDAHGFFCKEGTGLDDLENLLVKALFEVVSREGRNSPVILFMKDAEKTMAGNSGSYSTYKSRLEKISDNVLENTVQIYELFGFRHHNLVV